MLFESVQIGFDINISPKKTFFEYYEVIFRTEQGTGPKDLTTPRPKLIPHSFQRIIPYSFNILIFSSAKS